MQLRRENGNMGCSVGRMHYLSVVIYRDSEIFQYYRNIRTYVELIHYTPDDRS